MNKNKEIIVPTFDMVSCKVVKEIKFNPAFFTLDPIDVIRENNIQNFTLIVLN